MGRTTRRLVGLVVLAALGWLAWSAGSLFLAWSNIERVEFDVAGARRALQDTVDEPTTTTSAASVTQEVENSPTSAAPTTELPSEPTTTTTAPPDASSPGQWMLIVGNDARPEQPTPHADTIMLFRLPESDAQAVLLSFPRDLQVQNPCTGTPYKLANALSGCGTAANGPELLAITLENVTGIAIDHYAMFQLESLGRVVDAVGGVELCVENRVRFGGAEPIEFPKGCTEADGRSVTKWLRTRTTHEFVSGRWRAMDPSGDLERVRRQRDFVLQLFNKLSNTASPGELTSIVRAASDTFVLDEGLSMSEAIDLAWSMRGTDPTSIATPELAVTSGISSAGTYILTLDQPVSDLFPL